VMKGQAREGEKNQYVSCAGVVGIILLVVWRLFMICVLAGCSSGPR
jgi:uncharacterized protein YsxB (DUF464 family)